MLVPDYLDLDKVLHYLGWAFALKIVYSAFIECKNGLNGYILPRVWSLCVGKEDFVSKFGSWALVTGCTQGIGKEYAMELAARGMNIILVSRNRETLGLVAQEIEETHHVRTEIIVVDFTEPTAVDTVVKEVTKLKVDVGVLVNNVGMLGPHFIPFLEMERKMVRDMVTVNCGAVTQLTHALLPRMLELNKGAVVNICSATSFYVMPYFSEYSATKHFIAAFTAGLRAEVSSSNVIIQQIDPGQMNTNMARDLIPLSRLEAPRPDLLVSSSVLSLGWTDRTAGWWFHSLHRVVSSLLPHWFLSRFLKLFGYYQYKYSASKKKD